MITQKANFIKDVRYVILKPSLIDTLDLNKKRGKQRVYLSTRNSIRYNTKVFIYLVPYILSMYVFYFYS